MSDIHSKAIENRINLKLKQIYIKVYQTQGVN